MKLGKMLTGISAVVFTSLLGTALLIRPAVAQSSRPYVVFVNGWQNCCSWGMNALQNQLINQMNAELRYVPYSNFDSNGSSGNTSTDESFLRDGADFINNQLDKNRPLILIGHSFGGDSVLKLLPRINRRIQFVAVIDPVRTGGLRTTLKALNVPSNVDYFYNRWQENEAFPTDYIVNGSIACSARRCDQDSQFALTDINGKPHREKCGFFETCSTKQVRAGHQSLPTDDWIQRVIGEKIQEQLAAFQPPDRPRVGYFADGGATFYADGQKFCGFLSAAHYQMHSFGKDNVPRLGNRSRGEFGSDGGACSIPSGYFAYENATHYSLGNGQYCSFFTGDTYDRHSSQRPQEPRFGVLTSDPKGFMTWAGGCP